MRCAAATCARSARRRSSNLNALDLSTTLVVTLRKGLNDHEVGAIIRHALAQPCVRGVTFQPVQEAGRTDGYDRRAERLNVSEVRRLIAEQSDLFIAEDVVPVPCNPDTLAMAYALKLADEWCRSPASSTRERWSKAAPTRSCSRTRRASATASSRCSRPIIRRIRRRAA